MPTQSEKLNALRRLRDPNYAMAEVLGLVMGKVQSIKGEPGYTPVKGKDYFTEEEVRSVISYIESRIQKPADGKNGVDGKDGAIGPRGPKGESIKGEKGDTGAPGKNGVDGKNAEPIDRDKLIADTIQALVDTPEWKSMTNLALYSKYDQRWKGSGHLVAAGTNVTIEEVDGQQVISSVGGGGGLTALSSTEVPDESTTVFTFPLASAQPSYLIVDNVWMRATTKAGTVNWTWNAGAKQATLSVPPMDEILGIV